MAWVITIAGTSRTEYVLREKPAIQIDRMMGERSKLKLGIADPAETYRPQRNDEIAVTKDGAPLFAGVIVHTEETDITETSGRYVVVDAVDWNLYLDKALVWHHFVAGETLKQCLMDVVGKVGHGMTVHPSQATGPLMPEMFFDGCSAKSALDTLKMHSGWAWSADYQKQVRAVDVLNAPAAAWHISDANANYVRLSVSRDSSQYFNVALVSAGSGSPTPYEDDWTATEAQEDFVTSYPAATPPTEVWVDTPTAEGYWAQVGSGEEFTWSNESAQGTGTLHHTQGGLPAGTYVRLPYSAVRTFGVEYAHPTESQDPPTGVGRFARRFDHPEISTAAAALAQAQAYVATGVADAICVKYTTYAEGLEVGHAQVIQCSRHGLDGTFLIIGLSVSSHGEGTLLRHEVEAIDLPQFYRSWVERWRKAAGATGSTTVVGGAGGYVPGATPPIFIPLATRRDSWKEAPAETWVDAEDALPLQLNGDQFNGRLVRFRGYVRGFSPASYGITVRLRNLTDGTDAGVMAAPATHDWTTQGWTAVTFAVTLASGLKEYVLQQKTSLGATSFNTIGVLEVE